MDSRSAGSPGGRAVRQQHQLRPSLRELLCFFLCRIGRLAHGGARRLHRPLHRRSDNPAARSLVRHDSAPGRRAGHHARPRTGCCISIPLAQFAHRCACGCHENLRRRDTRLHGLITETWHASVRLTAAVSRLWEACGSFSLSESNRIRLFVFVLIFSLCSTSARRRRPSGWRRRRGLQAPPPSSGCDSPRQRR